MNLLSIPVIAMASINFYVGIYYLFFYIKRPQVKEHLPFACLCVSIGFYDLFCSGLYNSGTILEGIFWQRLQLDSIAVISVFLIWFTSIFTEQKNNKIIRIFIVLFLINLLATIILPPEYSLSPYNSAVKTIYFGNFQEITYYEAEVGIIYQIEIVLALITYLYYLFLFIRYYQKTKYKILLLILACMSTYFFGVLNDSLVALQVYSFIYISEYSFFFIILGMAYTLQVKFIDLHKANEELNVALEHKVSERTIEIQKLNEDLKRLVDYDGLTGAYNRRFFNEYIDIEMKRANNWIEYKTRLESDLENEMNFGLALIDVDQFKRINDTYGHLAGDRVLIQIVKITKSCIFTRDVLCRYGGDEFALLLTKTSRDGILQAAEKIRDEIDRHAFVFDDSHINEHITISVGLVIFDEVLNRGSLETLKLADDRLLRAKSSGKNRIIYDDR